MDNIQMHVRHGLFLAAVYLFLLVQGFQPIGFTAVPIAAICETCYSVNRECVTCDEEPDWYGTCYSFHSNCAYYECNGPHGDGPKCEPNPSPPPDVICGQNIWICTCPQCEQT